MIYESKNKGIPFILKRIRLDLCRWLLFIASLNKCVDRYPYLKLHLKLAKRYHMKIVCIYSHTFSLGILIIGWNLLKYTNNTKFIITKKCLYSLYHLFIVMQIVAVQLRK